MIAAQALPTTCSRSAAAQVAGQCRTFTSQVSQFRLSRTELYVLLPFGEAELERDVPKPERTILRAWFRHQI